MKKGISPLIAAVILIAFVIAVAGIVSGFFTGFFKQRQGEISQKGEAMVDCGTALFDADANTFSFNSTGNNKTELTVYVEGESDIQGFNMTVYNAGKDTEQISGASGTFSPGDSARLSGTTTLTPPFTKVTVTTPSCSGVTDSIENDTEDGWVSAELSNRF